MREELLDLYFDAFPRDNEAYARLFIERARADNIVTYREGGRLLSAGYIVDKRARFGKEEIGLPYLSAVATRREHRGKGYAARIMQAAFDRLYARGESLTALYPFNHEYYLRYGYANASFCGKRVVSGGRVFAHRPASRADIPAMAEVYRAFSAPYENCLLCGTDYFEALFLEVEADKNKIYLLEDGNGIFAYAVVENGEIVNYAARSMRLFLRAALFRGMAVRDFSLKRQAYIQMRILNPLRFLALDIYKKNFRRVRLSVTDPLLPQNTGVYLVTRRKREAFAVTRCDDGSAADLAYTIGGLSQAVFLGRGVFERRHMLFIDKY